MWHLSVTCGNAVGSESDIIYSYVSLVAVAYYSFQHHLEVFALIELYLCSLIKVSDVSC